MMDDIVVVVVVVVVCEESFAFVLNSMLGEVTLTSAFSYLIIIVAFS